MTTLLLWDNDTGLTDDNFPKFKELKEVVIDPEFANTILESVKMFVDGEILLHYFSKIFKISHFWN